VSGALAEGERGRCRGGGLPIAAHPEMLALAVVDQCDPVPSAGEPIKQGAGAVGRIEVPRERLVEHRCAGDAAQDRRRGRIEGTVEDGAYAALLIERAVEHAGGEVST